MTPLAFALGGPADIAIIAVVVVLLFGAGKIPTLFKSMGEGISEFKKATRDDEPTPVGPAAAKPEEK